jgi:hypothetical protein
MKALATFVDNLVSANSGRIAENELPAVRVFELDVNALQALTSLLDTAGHSYEIVDAAEQVLERNALDSGVAPFAISFRKPAREHEAWFVSTAAFEGWLSNPSTVGAVRVAACTHGFTTEAFRVSGWGESLTERSARVRKSPRRIVRDASGRGLVPADLRPFLLVDGSDAPSGDVAYETWAAYAAAKLLLAIATEVLSDNRVEFVGPPRLNIPIFDPEKTPELVDWFELVQEAARWIYDDDREVDLRHRLFSQEFARLAYGSTSIGSAMIRSGASALEGAKITYSFHVHEISKDALKSLSELRKAVSEDTQKMFESVRQVALSAAGAMFYVIGLVAARLSSAPMDAGVFDFLLFVGMTYSGVVVIVNYRVIVQQRELRSVWRSKVYRYLTDEEYALMVQDPNRRAELLLVIMLGCVLLVTGCTFLAAAWRF